jgi:multiple sugar transport system substrate-binding protein
VMAIDNYDITALAAKGGAMALDSLINSTKYSLDIFYPISLLEGVYQGKRYGLPYIGSTRAMTFNADLHAKANLASPADQWAKGTWTWDTFSQETAPLTVKDTSGRTQQFAYQSQHTLWSLATWIYTNGGDILNADRTACLLDQPPAVEAIQFQQDLVNKYHVSPSAADVKDVDLNGSGRVAMWDSWRGEIIGYQGYKFHWDIALPPIVPKVGKVALYKGNSMALYSHTKQVDAAWQFAQFICGPAANLVYVSLAGASPVQVPEVRDAFLKVNPPGHGSLYLEPLAQNYAKLLPLNPHWPDMEDKIDSALQAVFDENQNVQQAMKTLVPQVNQILAGAIS